MNMNVLVNIFTFFSMWFRTYFSEVYVVVGMIMSILYDPLMQVKTKSKLLGQTKDTLN